MPVDLLLNENFEILILGGDFVSGEATDQHKKILLLVNPGELKHSPMVGVGISQALKDEDGLSSLLSVVKAEFEKDGMKVQGLGIENGRIIENSYYK
jgi:hypothetical protein